MNARAALRDIEHLADDIGPREATSDNFTEAARFVQARFERLGYHVRRSRFRVPSGVSWGTPVPRGTSLNVIAEPEGFDAKKPHVVIGAHLDTVPANAGWSGDPWRPRVEAGRVVGLGAADTKGAIAAILCALDEARPDGVAVLFSGDEEAGSRVMHAFLQSPHAKDVKEAIVCEPTYRTAGISHRGVLGQTATLEGAGGHSSKADFMPKPLVQLARLAIALDELGRAHLHDGVRRLERLDVVRWRYGH